VAVPLPDSTLDAVREVVQTVRDQRLPAGLRDVRWVRLEGLHLTLVFIGPVPPDRVEGIGEAVRAAAAGARAGAGALRGAGTFPEHGRPRTLWIGVSEGHDVLDALAGRMPPVLSAAGKPLDDRPFRAHLTVARSDGLAAGPLIAARLADAMGDRRIPFTIDRITLFESVTGGGPARYIPVAEAALDPTR
jgi:2'-5' RNA ligase